MVANLKKNIALISERKFQNHHHQGMLIILQFDKFTEYLLRTIPEPARKIKIIVN